MQKAIILAATATLACTPAIAMASYSDNTQSTPAGNPSGQRLHANPLVSFNNRFTLGATGTYQYFKTHQAGGHPGNDIGFLPGVHAGASTMFNVSHSLRHLYVQAKGGYSAGDTHNAHPAGTTTDHLGHYQLEFGKGLQLSRRTMLIPYATFGQRFWNREIHTSATYSHQYFQNMFAGGGFKLDYQLTPRLVLDGNVMGASTIQPKMHTASAPKAHYKLGDRAMAKADIGADYRVKGPWHAYANVGYTYLPYGGSSAEHSANYEPSSYTHDVSVGAGVRYDF